MKEDIKKIWVDALRSGEYAQGDGRLYNGEDYCCLGVLCDIHNKMTKAGIWTHNTDEDGIDWVVYRDNVYGYDNGEVLPRAVCEWADIDPNPNVGQHPCGQKVYSTVAELNDYGYTFEDLARIIEERL